MDCKYFFNYQKRGEVFKSVLFKALRIFRITTKSNKKQGTLTLGTFNSVQVAAAAVAPSIQLQGGVFVAAILFFAKEKQSKSTRFVWNS